MAQSLLPTAVLPTPPPSSPQSHSNAQELAAVEAMLLGPSVEDEGCLDGPKPPPRYQGYQGFFAMEVAIDRAKPDIQYVQLVFGCYAAGVFRRNPQLHPLYTGALTPYMARYGRPSGMNCALQHLQFFKSNFGQFFSDLDSDTGVPPATFLSTTKSAVLCNICACVFSPPGFLAHALGGECKNWVARNRVDKALLQRADRDLNLSVVLRAIQPKEATEEEEEEKEEADRARSPTPEQVAVKAAFIEWNSRVGVTQEIWALL